VANKSRETANLVSSKTGVAVTITGDPLILGVGNTDIATVFGSGKVSIGSTLQNGYLYVQSDENSCCLSLRGNTVGSLTPETGSTLRFEAKSPSIQAWEIYRDNDVTGDLAFADLKYGLSGVRTDVMRISYYTNPVSGAYGRVSIGTATDPSDESRLIVGLGTTNIPEYVSIIGGSDFDNPENLSAGAGILLQNNNPTDNNFNIIRSRNSDGVTVSFISFQNTSHSTNEGAVQIATRASTDTGGPKVRATFSGATGAGTTVMHIIGTGGTSLFITNATGSGASIEFSDHESENWQQKGQLTFYHQDTKSYGRGSALVFDTDPIVASHAIVSTDDFVAVGTLTENYSDERLKNIQGRIPNALEKLLQLNGYYYTQNDLATQIGYKDIDKVQVGVSAQEVLNVLPEVVTIAPVTYTGRVGVSTEDPFYTVHYPKLVPLLIESIKDQQEIINALRQQIQYLQVAVGIAST
jgi:hypothetical protein